MNLQSIDDVSFATTIASPTPVLVEFWAQWCGPCLALKPALAELAKTYTVRTLDTEAHQAIAANYGVRALPTMLVFKDGRVVDSLVGAAPKEKIAAMLQRQISA